MKTMIVATLLLISSIGQAQLGQQTYSQSYSRMTIRLDDSETVGFERSLESLMNHYVANARFCYERFVLTNTDAYQHSFYDSPLRSCVMKQFKSARGPRSSQSHEFTLRIEY